MDSGRLSGTESCQQPCDDRHFNKLAARAENNQKGNRCHQGKTLKSAFCNKSVLAAPNLVSDNYKV